MRDEGERRVAGPPRGEARQEIDEIGHEARGGRAEVGWIDPHETALVALREIAGGERAREHEEEHDRLRHDVHDRREFERLRRETRLLAAFAARGGEHVLARLHAPADAVAKTGEPLRRAALEEEAAAVAVQEEQRAGRHEVAGASLLHGARSYALSARGVEDCDALRNAAARFGPFVAVMLVAAALLLFRLGTPDWTPAQPAPGVPRRYVWDECLYGFTAHRMLAGDPSVWRFGATIDDLAAFDASDIGPHAGYAVYHPPLAVFTMTASSAALGWSAFAVRLPGAIAGLVIVACTFAIARRVGGAAVGVLAASLVALDGVWFTISRIAIPHAYVAAATTAAAYTALLAWQDETRRERFTLATGLLCGLGLAFKTSAAFALVALGATLLARMVTATPPGARARALGVWTAAFVAIPPCVYLASWLPYFTVWDGTFAGFVAQHEGMRAWHAKMPASMGPSTPWWTWPVVWKPVRLYEEGARDGTIATIFARGNPLLWWAALAAVPLAAVRFVRARAAADLFLAAGYLASWLVYAGVPRFGFSYYMLPAAPFAAAAVAVAISGAFASRPTARVPAMTLYALAAAAVFASMYAEIAAVPRPR